MTLFEHTPGWDKTAAQMADKRMRQWTLDLEVASRKGREPPPGQLREEVHPCLTISRETGTEGAVIARRVGEMLGLDILHREILDYMAQRYGLRRGMLDFVDERTSDWFSEIFGKWLDKQLVTQSEYLVHATPPAVTHSANALLIAATASFASAREPSGVKCTFAGR